MSAAALTAHRQLSAPDATCFRLVREAQRISIPRGTHCQEQLPRVRGRRKHCLPCEP